MLAGLVAAFAFDEGTGTTVADVSGNNNNGVITGAGWSAVGKYGGALSFDGLNDSVTVADAPSLDLTSAMTIEAWVQPAAIDSDYRTVLLKERTSGLAYALYATDGANRPPASYVNVAGDRSAVGLSTLTIGGWTHLASTFDGSNLRLYVNGALVRTTGAAGAISVSTGSLRVGGNSVWGEYFQGLIDEVRIYDTVLTAAQIGSDMASPIDDDIAPVVSGVTPAAGATGVLAAANVTATFSEAMDGSTMTAAAVELRGPTDDVVPTLLSYDAATRTVRLDPHSDLALATSYTAYVQGGASGVKDVAGNALAADFSWSFTTAGAAPPPSLSISNVTVTEGNSGTGNATFTVTLSASSSQTVTVNYATTNGSATAGSDYVTKSGTLTYAPGVLTQPVSIVVNGDTANEPNETFTVTLSSPTNAVLGTATGTGTITNDDTPPGPNGLIAAFGFKEGTGTTTADVSPNANNGTLANAAWTTAGKYGNALSFNGTSSMVTIPDANTLDLTTAMTLEAWVRPSALVDWTTAILKERSGGLAYSLYVSDNTNQPPAGYIFRSGANVSVVGASAVPLNTWTHLATTYDGANLRLYVNGVQVAVRATSGAITTSTSPLRIGGNNIWGEYFSGIIDEVRVYSRALGVAEIQADMNTPVDGADTTAPTVSITSPANTTTVAGTINVTADAGDNVGIAGVQFLLDGANLGAEDTTAPYSVSWSTTGAANAGHVLTARARDAAGNITTSEQVNVTVDNSDTTAPAVTITVPADGSTVTGTVDVSANAADTVGVVGVQFLLDGADFGAEDTSAPYSISWDTTAAGNGNHTLTARARDAAGNIGVSSVAITVSNSTGAQFGEWSSVMNWPLIAITSVLLKDGRVLMWDGGPACIGSPTARVWNPANNTFTPVPVPWFANQDDDIWCSGQALLADGRVLVVGGHDCDGPAIGINMVSIFDPATMTWTRAPDMQYRRWYPTATTLADGRVLVTAGSVFTTTDYVPVPEIYDPVTNSWTTLTAANRTIPNYPFVFQTPDGRVVVAGSDEAKMGTHILDVATQTWSTVDATVLDAGSAVMYRPGQVLKAGSSYLSPPADNGGSVPSSANAYVIDMNQPGPTWTQTGPMASPRTHLNLTMLPDGNVLATGGSTDIGGVNPATAVYTAEVWSPATQTWSTLASMQRPRLYHSTALLLPDGRVLVAGGGHNYWNSAADEFNAEIYSPGYLFKGPRPTISTSPSNVAYSSDFFVSTPDGAGIASVALIRSGSVTHSFNMDQRYVPLSFTQTTGGLTVQAPANANLAPPGHYMLFIVNSDGVPSIAPIVRLPAPYEDAQTPSAPAGLVATSSVGSVTLNWSPSSDNIGVTNYNVHRSLSPGFTPTASNRVAQPTSTSFFDSGLTSTTYYYVVTAQDAAGNLSAPSVELAVPVAGDTVFPSVSVSAPADAATVSGTIDISATAFDDIGVSGVQFLLDGNNLGAEDTAAPYTISWNTGSEINGTHVLTARARDAAGNSTTSLGVTVNVSNAAPSGLVMALGFNDASGTAASDSSGFGNQGAVSGAIWTASGRFGGGLSFDGVNDLVTIADAASLDLTTGMTLEAWVNPTVIDADYRTVLLKERPSGLAYALYATDGANRPPSGWVNISGDRSAVGTTTLGVGAWTHLATTFNGNSLQLYVNGALVRTTARTGSIAVSADVLRIGGNNVWGEYFSGQIDEVRVYNRALAATEIQTDMNTPIGSPLSASPAPANKQTNSHSLTPEVLAGLRAEAISRWESVGLSATAAKTLQAVPVVVTDLPGSQLGLASSSTIWIDIDAAGHGWFVDLTPNDDSEFPSHPGLESFDRMDLLSALLHEYGHLLGENHSEDSSALMAASLSPGERRTPQSLPTVHESSSHARGGRFSLKADVSLWLAETRDLIFSSTEVFRKTQLRSASAIRRWGR